MISLTYKDRNSGNTRSSYGTLGLDFNDGFIELSETNQHGNLIGQRHYDILSHGKHGKTGNKVTNELRQIVSDIVKLAKAKGKDITIENLDFMKKKSEVQKGQSPKYNKMLHGLEYAKYTNFMKDACAKANIGLRIINPAWTSYVGEAKYGEPMKLNRHQAASFVIARRGQGFKDYAGKKHVF